MPRPPSLVPYPRHDTAFAAFVTEAVGQVEPPHRGDPDVIERALRRWYPRAAVHPQDELASFGDPVWYVYRDGQAPLTAPRDWWTQDGVPTVSFDASGTFLEADDAACALVDVRSGSLAGTHWSELVRPPAAGTDAGWIWQELQREGRAQSVFERELPDGRRILIEFRTERTRDPNRFLSYWRPQPDSGPGNGSGPAT